MQSNSQRACMQQLTGRNIPEVLPCLMLKNNELPTHLVTPKLSFFYEELAIWQVNLCCFTHFFGLLKIFLYSRFCKSELFYLFVQPIIITSKNLIYRCACNGVHDTSLFHSVFYLKCFGGISTAERGLICP